jgi:hypothetical protein
MFKKTIILLSLAVICVMLFSSVAIAAEPASQLDARLIYGEIAAVDAGTLTLQNGNGENVTFLLDDDTRYRAANLEAPGFDDLQIGVKVAVFGSAMGDGERIARLVVLLPDNFDPSQWAAVRTRGEITEIGVDNFTVQSQADEPTTFYVDDTTRFFGQISDSSDLQTGWMVAVGGVESEAGVLLARLVIAADLENTKTYVGTISEVMPAAGTFIFVTRGDQQLNIVVDENTKFASRDGKIQSLADLTPDMLAIVVGIAQGDDMILATRIAAAHAEDLPNFDVRAGGTVLMVGDNTLTIQFTTGEEKTFLIDNETKFRGRGGISGLSDLEPEMVVFVGAEGGDAELPLAKLVLVGKQ